MGDNRPVAGSLDLTLANGRLVCRARVAETFWSRFRGLMLTRALEPGTGFLLPRTSAVHTHFMRFAIDVVFLDADDRVVRIAAALRPWRFAGAKGATTALELAAGECDRLGVAEGDELRRV